MISFVRLSVFVVVWNAVVRMAQSTPPNIIWMWFDDLGIGDVSFMGGDVPTPILDALVLDKSVKLNFHYSESVCSASRSAFLTGRYAFKSGLNWVGGIYQDYGFNSSRVLFPEILADDSLNYNNMIAGKWHVGRNSASRSPINRGFNAGLYLPTNADYYFAKRTESVALLDLQFGPITNQAVKDARDAILSDGFLKISDTYGISTVNGNVYASPVEKNTSEYIEDVFVDEINAFIAAQNDSDKPFFAYYSLWTPHVPLASPPTARDNVPVDYSVCEGAYNVPSGDCFNDDRCLYCAQIHYASLGIEAIVEEVKDNANIDWSNTVFVVTSDNGPLRGNTVFGSPMPLRGKKGTVFEGGVRSPTFIFGGLVEAFTTNRCEYNEVVHISDWYHIFMSMIGVGSSHPDYNPDADHASSIWENIKCSCTATTRQERRVCKTNNPPREELMTMRMCADDGEGNSFLHSAAVIKDGYKLIVNGRQYSSNCPTLINAANSGFSYSSPSLVYATPNSGYYTTWYQGVRQRMGNTVFNRVFKSVALESLAPQERNNPAYVPFQFDEYLLYNIADDKIEACALDLSVTTHSDKKDELLALLNAAKLEYDSPDSDDDPVYAAFQAMIQSQPSCNASEYVPDVVYLPPWSDSNDDPVDYTTLWSDFVDNYQSCN